VVHRSHEHRVVRTTQEPEPEEWPSHEVERFVDVLPDPGVECLFVASDVLDGDGNSQPRMNDLEQLTVLPYERGAQDLVSIDDRLYRPADRARVDSTRHAEHDGYVVRRIPGIQFGLVPETLLRERGRGGREFSRKCGIGHASALDDIAAIRHLHFPPRPLGHRAAAGARACLTTLTFDQLRKFLDRRVLE
jgi:hypothetical protein